MRFLEVLCSSCCLILADLDECSMKSALVAGKAGELLLSVSFRKRRAADFEPDAIEVNDGWLFPSREGGDAESLRSSIIQHCRPHSLWYICGKHLGVHLTVDFLGWR